jgi:hypothetical protein
MDWQSAIFNDSAPNVGHKTGKCGTYAKISWILVLKPTQEKLANGNVVKD